MHLPGGEVAGGAEDRDVVVLVQGLTLEENRVPVAIPSKRILDASLSQ